MPSSCPKCRQVLEEDEICCAQVRYTWRCKSCFKLTSGLHSAEYLQCALVLQHPAAAEKLGRLMAEELTLETL